MLLFIIIVFISERVKPKPLGANALIMLTG